MFCSMLLSETLDPRRYAAARNAVPEGDGEANPWAAEDAAAVASQLADLAELRALAMGLARRVAAEAANAAPDVGGDLARQAEAALNGLARTVRPTARLEKQLRDERARGVVQAASAAAAARGATKPVKIEHTQLTEAERAALNGRLVEMVTRKQTIVGVVREILEADGRDADTVEDVGDVLGRRLLDWEASDTCNLPIGRMVARMCRQLRVGPVDWSRFKDRDWAAEEAAGAAPGSPFGSAEIPVTRFHGGVPIPDADTGTLEALARGFEPERAEGEDADAGGDDPPVGSSP